MTAGLVDSVLAGDRRSLARALTVVENRDPSFRDLLKGLAPRCGQAHRIGITGPPGVGKSTLVSALIRAARVRGRRVAVLAVDPTSPYTGGALLGDRIRMGEHVHDEGVFVRSMATRGALGGLSGAAGDAMDVLDAAGFDAVLVETVGVGQSEVEVAGETETTLVVLAPGAGDGIQAMKSGLMEVADLWIVNKGDDPRAEMLRLEIIQSLGLTEGSAPMDARVLVCSALDGRGVPELWDALEARVAALISGGERGVRRREHLLRRVRVALRELLDRALPGDDSDEAIALAQAIVRGERTVHGAAEDLLRRTLADLMAQRGDAS